MFKTTRRCFCAFCRSPRAVYLKKRLSPIDVAFAAAAAGLLSMLVWQELDPRATMFFALGLGLAQIFVMIRWRFSIVCRRCGFDPILYKSSPAKAAARVSEHMRAERASPGSAFREPLNLPVIRRPAPPREPKVAVPNVAAPKTAAPKTAAVTQAAGRTSDAKLSRTP